MSFLTDEPLRIEIPPKCSWEDEGDELPPTPHWKPLSPVLPPMPASPPIPAFGMWREALPQVDGTFDEETDEDDDSLLDDEAVLARSEAILRRK